VNRFITAEQAAFAIAFMCRQLEVSSSGFCASRKRPVPARADAEATLTTQIRAINAASAGTYGTPRVQAELADAHAISRGRKRVARRLL
jgi:hypothetical protein